MIHAPNSSSISSAVFVGLAVVTMELPWELLYADDLAVIAETEEELIKRLNEWKDNVELKGMRVTHTRLMALFPIQPG